MKKIRILCYGDSNTWGAIVPGRIHRFDRLDDRYTKLLERLLGRGFEVIEEGFIARTVDTDDIRLPKGNRNGTLTFVPIVCSHDPLDYIVIMLGTNDMKDRFDKTANDLVKPLKEKYVDYVRYDLAETLTNHPKFVIIAPPLIEFDEERYAGAKAKSRDFNKVNEKFAKDNDCLFVNNDGVTLGSDGVHMNVNGHKVLAEKLYKVISDDVKSSRK